MCGGAAQAAALRGLTRPSPSAGSGAPAPSPPPSGRAFRPFKGCRPPARHPPLHVHARQAHVMRGGGEGRGTRRRRTRGNILPSEGPSGGSSRTEEGAPAIRTKFFCFSPRKSVFGHLAPYFTFFWGALVGAPWVPAARVFAGDVRSAAATGGRVVSSRIDASTASAA
ncbi:Protein of unknown function [Gryllus bimaculatus]|nr:Protein of unknown function [Gryllus bimaculatus]